LKFWLFVEYLFLFVNSIISWFMIGNTFLFSYIFLRNICIVQNGILLPDNFNTAYPSVTNLVLYMMLLGCTFIIAMGSKPDTTYSLINKLYKILAVIWGINMIIVMIFIIVVSYWSVSSVAATTLTRTWPKTPTTSSTAFNSIICSLWFCCQV